MTKPFSIRELTARVKAIFRRMEAMRRGHTEEIETRIQIGTIVIDTDGHEVTRDGQQVELTPKEFELLVYFASHRGKVLSRDRLLHAVWNYDFVGDSRIVDVHVSHLREKIEQDSKRPTLIKTVRGVGYKLEG
jgi:two-component system alkaline phosphatase synthesis response regulator PhoP